MIELPSSKNQETGWGAILLDLIPTVIFALLALIMGFVGTQRLDIIPDFAFFYYAFLILLWVGGVIVSFFVRKRFIHCSRWLRSFIAAVCSVAFYFTTAGSGQALAEEATYHWRLIHGNYINGICDGPWCFYGDNSGGNWGSGFAGTWNDTVFYLQVGLVISPFWLPLLLLICFLNDYSIRFYNFKFKTISP